MLLGAAVAPGVCVHVGGLSNVDGFECEGMHSGLSHVP